MRPIILKNPVSCLIAVCLFLTGFKAQAQIEEPDSTWLDTSSSGEWVLDANAQDLKKLWDTAQMGIIALQSAGRQTLCLQLTDDQHCCFAAPCKGLVTSNFGWRGGRLHAGIDIDLETGDPVYAAFDGIVRQAGWNSGYGFFVIISHFNGLETLYGHLSILKLNPLQPVRSGQIIGNGGNTGRSRGSHLHFEVRYFGKPVNPKLLIDFEEYSLHTNTLDISHASTFSRSNFVNEAPSVVIVMDDSVYRSHEQRYEANRMKVIKENERKRRELERKKKAKAEKLRKERIKNAKTLTHTVRKGDTLSSIARKYGTTVDKICRLNKMKSTDILDLGRKLKVK